MMEQVKDFAANVYEAFSTPQQLEKWFFFSFKNSYNGIQLLFLKNASNKSTIYRVMICYHNV